MKSDADINDSPRPLLIRGPKNGEVAIGAKPKHASEKNTQKLFFIAKSSIKETFSNHELCMWSVTEH